LCVVRCGPNTTMKNRTITDRLKELAEKPESVSPRAYGRRLTELLGQLTKASGDPTPALTLYRLGARTPLFHLEALARVHKEVLDEDPFTELYFKFKALEDALGAIDFSDALLKKLTSKDENTDPLRIYFTGRRAEACARLDHLLHASEWLPEKNTPPKAVQEIVDFLEETKFPGPGKERKKFSHYLREQCEELHQKFEENAFDLSKLEAGVHEVRRRIRWLSIIPAATDGLFVRTPDEPGEDPLAWYRKPEIVSSPYNQFNKRKEVREPIWLASPPFLALSWLISELGVWKDRGQLAESIRQAWTDLGENEQNAQNKTKQILGEDLVTLETITNNSTEAIKRIIKDEVLLQLAKGFG